MEKLEKECIKYFHDNINDILNGNLCKGFFFFFKKKKKKKKKKSYLTFSR